MMSALAMILTAAIVIPGDGPKRVSGEAAKPQRLDLRGSTWILEYEGCCGATVTMGGEDWNRALRIQDKGGGILRLSLPTRYKDDFLFILCTGTYQQEKDRVTIHFHLVDEKDSRFLWNKVSKGRLILRRDKSITIKIPLR